MKGRTEAKLAVVGDDGRPVGHLRICLLPKYAPGDTPPPLLDLSDEHGGQILPPIQLLEGVEYRFVFDLDGEGIVETDHPEVFDADDSASGRNGRLRPKLNTGTIRARVALCGTQLGHVMFEVRSRKVDYLTDYKTMLGDLTTVFADAVMLRFATGQHGFNPDDTRDARTLYQRFAFLQSVIGGGSVDDALHQIRRRPYLEWEQHRIARDPSLGVRPSSSLVRQLSRGGPKQPWPGAGQASLPSLPRSVHVVETTPTTDNIPNQFVRYALETWRDHVAQLRDLLEQETKPSSAILRGRVETQALYNRLGGWLQSPPFRDAGLLRRLPNANQVLEKRTGYRHVYRAFFQSELASNLTWNGGEEVYGAGKRDVATLYEYWCYLQLAEILSAACDRPLDFGKLVELDAKGITVNLRAGDTPVLRGRVVRDDVVINVGFWFNRTFERGTSTDPYGDVSWSRTMRPDFSLKLEVEDSKHDVQLGSSWLHFDAKYRIEELKSLFGDSGSQGAPVYGVKREDLLKMHAYRDAIRRSVGAYVLYPGDQEDENPVYGELLPGLGAFRLRPGETNLGGRAGLTRFIDEVLDHFASRRTEQQRVRYWTMRTYGAHKDVGLRPAADTVVLLAYTRSEDHRAWVCETRLYNVRADLDRRGGVPVGAEVLGAELVLLHGPERQGGLELWTTTGEVEVATAEELMSMGYPTPGGQKYFVLRLGERIELPAGLTMAGVVALRESSFAPEAVSLAAVLRAGRRG